MIRYRAWLALPVLAGLFINTAPAARAAAGDTVQTTGGGWITPEVPTTPTSTGIVRTAANNVKATFGFVASATVQTVGGLPDFQGELSYHDHGTGLRLHSLSITNVSVNSAAHTATFSGSAQVETSLGSAVHEFTVNVYDGGEPSTSDTFSIVVTDALGAGLPYQAAGTLGGGNVQVRP